MSYTNGDDPALDAEVDRLRMAVDLIRHLRGAEGIVSEVCSPFDEMSDKIRYHFYSLLQNLNNLNAGRK